MQKDTDYNAVLLEQIRDQNQAVLEAVGQIQSQIHTLATNDALETVAQDIKTIKVAISDTNHDMQSIDGRLTMLERAT